MENTSAKILTLGELFNSTRETLKNNSGKLIKIFWIYFFANIGIGIIQIVAGMLSLGIIDDDGQAIIDGSRPTGMLLLLLTIFVSIIAIIVGFYIFVMLTRIARNTFTKQKENFSEVNSFAFRNAWRVFVTNFVIALFIVIPTAFILFAGFFLSSFFAYGLTGNGFAVGIAILCGCVFILLLLAYIVGLSVVWVFAPFAAAHKGMWPMKTLNYSYALVRKNLGKVVGNLFVLGLIVGMVVFMIGAVLGFGSYFLALLLGNTADSFLIADGLTSIAILPVSFIYSAIYVSFTTLLFSSLDTNYVD